MVGVNYDADSELLMDQLKRKIRIYRPIKVFGRMQVGCYSLAINIWVILIFTRGTSTANTLGRSDVVKCESGVMYYGLEQPWTERWP